MCSLSPYVSFIHEYNDNSSGANTRDTFEIFFLKGLKKHKFLRRLFPPVMKVTHSH